jgi:ribonuclease P protein component
VVLRRRGDGEPARLGVVASRKVGTAVARNRGKRLVREWFRRRAEPVGDSIDLVVILRLGAAELSYQAACAELEATLNKALSRAAGATRRPARRKRPNRQ